MSEMNIKALPPHIGPVSHEGETVALTAETIDRHIEEVSNALETELNKSESEQNWNEIDKLLSILSVLLLRRSGRTEKEITQKELEFTYKELKNVVSTYKNEWKLAISTVINLGKTVGGAVGITGTIGYIATLSKTYKTVMTMAQTVNPFTDGLHGLIINPWDQRIEGRRTEHNYWEQRFKTNTDSHRQGAYTEKNAEDKSLQAWQQKNQQASQVASRILAASSM